MRFGLTFNKVGQIIKIPYEVDSLDSNKVRHIDEIMGMTQDPANNYGPPLPQGKNSRKHPVPEDSGGDGRAFSDEYGTEPPNRKKPKQHQHQSDVNAPTSSQTGVNSAPLSPSGVDAPVSPQVDDEAPALAQPDTDLPPGSPRFGDYFNSALEDLGGPGSWIYDYPDPNDNAV